MVNSVEHLNAMKLFIPRRLPPWPCLAGKSSMIIRLDGSFTPCMELYGTDEDWGNIYEGHKFDPYKLTRLKKNCSPNCLSTCNFQVNHYSSSLTFSLQWLAKHAYSSFLGVS
jgi:radical SAM protein with 4Fe4S-binding SPASM domain